MARPRIFISSTYYDLKHIRASLEAFIDSLGYEAVLFESGDIAFRHDQALDESCYQEVRNCHMLVLIIGGRYGSAASEEQKTTPPIDREEAYRRFNSITKKEYETARERDIPVFIFVDKNVLAEHQTFKRNRDNDSISYAYVDSVNIFYLLDDILTQRRNNFIRGFEKFDDISVWLRDQWAGLFADFLMRTRTESSISDLGEQITDLRQVTSVLKEYSELIIKKIKPDNFEKIISEQENKIHKNRASRFLRESLIGYIRHKDHGVSTLSADKIFSSFISSTSIDDFFKKIGFTGENAENFMELNRSALEQEYSILIKNYLSDGSSIS